MVSTSLAAPGAPGNADDLTNTSCDDKVDHGAQGINTPSFDSNTTTYSSGLHSSDAADHTTFRTATANLNSTAKNASAKASSAITTTSSSISFAESLFNAGPISQAQFDLLTLHIRRDINTATHKDALTRSVSDNISIRISISHRRIEAVAAVFKTAELLEAILVRLPAKNLIFDIQLVCRGFCEAVQSSQKLQRRMYEALC